jgi:hypothetical protein
MADISDDIDNWSATAASNSPSGSTSIGTGLDDNLRAIQAGVKAWKNSVDPYAKKNYLINGGFCIAQRATSFTSTGSANNDDTYNLDRWTLLSDGNDIVDITQNTATVPTGSLYSCALDVETANKKFGIIQFIEQKNAHRIIGGTASLSFKARKGASNSTVNTMRAAVIAWSSTGDSVTSDVVSAWNASGTNPTLVANWTYENTPVDLTLTDSFQTFTIENISIDTASTTNVAVLLYYNDADGTVGDFIYITDVQLEAGAASTDFEQRSIQEELSLCQRYYEKTFAQGTDVAQASGTFAGAIASYVPIGDSVITACSWWFKAEKRVVPTVTFYNPTQANANWRNQGNTGDATAGTVATGTSNVGVGGSVGSAQNNYLVHATASAEL